MIDLQEKIIEKSSTISSDNTVNKILSELSLEEDYKNILVLILKPNYEIDYSNFEMFGIKGIDYVKSACKMFETKIVDYDMKDDVIDVIKQNISNKKYVLVLFSDTPLITKKTVTEIVDYFLIKKLCSLKFNRGFMFETNYLKSVEKIYNPLEQNFFEEDFVKVSSSSNFSQALEILKKRIIAYHQHNGVIFLDPNSAFIDAIVNIEKGTIIGTNVQILGKSIIKENCVLTNCLVNKVILEKNVSIKNSVVENSVVCENSVISDFSVIKNKTIEANTTIQNEKMI